MSKLFTYCGGLQNRPIKFVDLHPSAIEKTNFQPPTSNILRPSPSQLSPLHPKLAAPCPPFQLCCDQFSYLLSATMHLNTVSKPILGLLAAASQVTAFFRLPCAAPIVIQRADPVVNPGTVSSHVHTIMGGNGFGFEMDFASTQRSTCSSCIVKEDLSNYWTPVGFDEFPSRLID